MLNRFFIFVFLLCNTSSVLAFDFKSLIGDSHKEAATPIDMVIEARAKVENLEYRPGVEIVAKDSILFKGFSSIYVGGILAFWTRTQIDSDDNVVLDLSFQKMYIKHNGQWSRGDLDAIKNYYLNSLFPQMNTDLLISNTSNEKPKAVMVYGHECNLSRGAEGALEQKKIPHSIIVMTAFDKGKDKAAALDLACGNASTWKNWAQGKNVSPQNCMKREDYEKFNWEFYKLIVLLGFDELHYPMVISSNGEISQRPENEAELLDKVR